MFRAGILLCIVVIGVKSVTGQTAPPHLQFTCEDAQGEIGIPTGQISTYGSLYAVGNKTGVLCTVKKDGSSFTIKNCALDLPVTVYIMKLTNQNPNSGTWLTPAGGPTTMIPGLFIIGGDGIAAYTLECFKDHDVNPVNNLISSIRITPKATLIPQMTVSPKAVDYSVYVEMSIWKAGHVISPGDVIIAGDPLLVLISGPAGPKYYMEGCRAFDTIHNATTIELLDNKPTLYDTLLTRFAPGNITNTTYWHDKCNKKFCIMATLYAFHFKDSNSVTLSCTIDICAAETPNGPCVTGKSNNGAALNVPSRKRRQNYEGTHVLKSTFVVQDHFATSRPEEISKGNILKTSHYLMGTLATVWIFGALV